jgi:AhpD family alkylhydroperoxidase
MARISYRSREQLPENARAAFDRAIGYGPFGHQVGAFAHRPPIMRNLYRMLIELREEHVLPRRYLELAVLTVSRLNCCAYRAAHHAPMLRAEGLAADAIGEHAEHPDLDEIDRLVVEYARGSRSAASSTASTTPFSSRASRRQKRR